MTRHPGRTFLHYIRAFKSTDWQFHKVDELYVVQERCATDFKATKIVKGLVGDWRLRVTTGEYMYIRVALTSWI